MSLDGRVQDIDYIDYYATCYPKGSLEPQLPGDSYTQDINFQEWLQQKSSTFAFQEVLHKKLSNIYNSKVQLQQELNMVFNIQSSMCQDCGSTTWEAELFLMAIRRF